MKILQAGWLAEEFVIWAEASEPAEQLGGIGQPGARPVHPYCCNPAVLRESLATLSFPIKLSNRQLAQIHGWLPSYDEQATVSSPLIDGKATLALAAPLKSWSLCGFRLNREQTLDLLAQCLTDELLAAGIMAGGSLLFWSSLIRFAASLVSRQHFLPGLNLAEQGAFARWEPVFLGEDNELSSQLLSSMPECCTALSSSAAQCSEAGKSAAFYSFIHTFTDYLVRQSLSKQPEQSLLAAPEKHVDTMHRRWLDALVSADSKVTGSLTELRQLLAQISDWRKPALAISRAPFRLCLRVEEPAKETEDAVVIEADTVSADDTELLAEHNSARQAAVDRAAERKWYVRYLLQSLEDPGVYHTAEQLLSAEFHGQLARKSATEIGPREYLLRSLGQVARFCPAVERSFESTIPQGFSLNSKEVYEFLSQTAPALTNAGFGLQLPSWWRKGKKKLKSAFQVSPFSQGGFFSLDEIVKFDLSMMLGTKEINLSELEELMRLKLPLILWQGEWIELNPQHIEGILSFWRRNQNKKLRGHELLRIALGDIQLPEGLAFEGLTGEGPLKQLLDVLKGKISPSHVKAHKNFSGELRSYQESGVSWLNFLAECGLGACLADDMGLGKTVQTLSFLQSRWHQTNKKERRPALLVCPVSVTWNWQQEAEKFVPDLPVMIHYGQERLKGTELKRKAEKHSLLITSYSLLQRDLEEFKQVDWSCIILDEAQNVKNPETKQARAAVSLKAQFRIALTGTPVENTVGDLWSIMNFLNPGFLGTHNNFKDKFWRPIQFNRDEQRINELKQLTSPFILRRLKTDKSIINDLPDKVESKEPCTLTKEQASLYALVVADVSKQIEDADGMKRKSLVLSTLMKLKQICDHPSLYLDDHTRIAGRSGKLERLTEIVEEILKSRQCGLVFTQFLGMGSMIKNHLENQFGKEVLFLRGENTSEERARMVQRFQSEDGPPLFVLSLKAGGSGLNLTRASHVIHYDRWWNPAVENQATDRAYRIGQKNMLQVHKFICTGTLEEKIDQMIESKSGLAASIVGSQEERITEMSNAELRSLLELRESRLMGRGE